MTSSFCLLLATNKLILSFQLCYLIEQKINSILRAVHGPVTLTLMSHTHTVFNINAKVCTTRKFFSGGVTENTTSYI